MAIAKAVVWTIHKKQPFFTRVLIESESVLLRTLSSHSQVQTWVTDWHDWNFNSDRPGRSFPVPRSKGSPPAHQNAESPNSSFRVTIINPFVELIPLHESIDFWALPNLQHECERCCHGNSARCCQEAKRPALRQRDLHGSSPCDWRCRLQWWFSSCCSKESVRGSVKKGSVSLCNWNEIDTLH